METQIETLERTFFPIIDRWRMRAFTVEELIREAQLNDVGYGLHEDELTDLLDNLVEDGVMSYQFCSYQIINDEAWYNIMHVSETSIV